MSFDELFLEHPRAVGETYAEHRRAALSFAWPLLAAALACFVHALIPGLFARTGSKTVESLQARMRRRAAAPV